MNPSALSGEIPTSDAWRYTPVGVVASQFEAATDANRVRPNDGSVAEITTAMVDELAGVHGGARFVFVNGWYSHELSDHRSQIAPGISLDLCDEVTDERDGPIDLFDALNQHAAHDRAGLVIAPNTRRDQPMHIVHLAAPQHLSSGTISHPRTRIEVGAGASVTIIESYCSLPGSTVTNAATTLRLGRGARVDLYRIQAEATSSTHLGRTLIAQHARSTLRYTAVSIGGSIARNALTVDLIGDGASSDLAGVDLVTGRQRHDTLVTVGHAASHCRSDQRFTGVASGHGRTAFGGEIVVRPGTVDSDANQTSRSLVLSPDAKADARPWLRILADDVRCTHGATIGRLDDEALFYLRSRGITHDEARTMLVEAFIGDVTDRIAHDSLRDWAMAAVAARDTVTEVVR